MRETCHDIKVVTSNIGNLYAKFFFFFSWNYTKLLVPAAVALLTILIAKIHQLVINYN